MTKFSPELIKMLQKHFEEKHGANISEEETENFLESLADLYLLFTGKNKS